ncbi:MAG: hypothetical protein N4A63_13175 [Vallitalea sp.]|jgi:hypothetical protein|nr:hypothetical protein [Vallitalea sp.]
MKKIRYIKIFTYISLVIIFCTSCKSKESDLVCREQYFKLINNVSNQIWSLEGFSYSYYYNLG